MLQLMEHILDSAGKGQDLVLVTVVRRAGSTPRGVGSQMLVSTEGLACGTIGGGLVEGRAIARAQELIASRECMVEDMSLNLSKSDGLNMVCGGDMTLLYSFVDSSDPQWADVAQSTSKHLVDLDMAYLVLGRPASQRGVVEGNVALLDGEGTCIAGNQDLAHDGIVRSEHGVLGESSFVMPLPLPHRAIVFGAGHVAHALVPQLNNVGFSCVVYDGRPELANEERFPNAKRIICDSYENIGEQLTLGPRDYVIIMTNSHESDFLILNQVLRHKLWYVGLMGSKKKIATARARALEAGVSQEALDSVHWPIGLDIKAETPAEIAISVVAECIYHRASQH